MSGPHQTVVACLLILAVLLPLAHGHAFLSRPASRNADSYYSDPNDIKEWTPSGVFGGGVRKEYAGGTLEWPNGVHGVCGDSFDAPRQRWMEPRAIQETYVAGQVIPIEVTIGTNHYGRFSFAVCPSTDVTDECFDKNPIYRADSLWPGKQFWYIESVGRTDNISHEVVTNTKYEILPSGINSYYGSLAFRVFYKLPEDMVTDHGVLRWYWTSGNSCTPPCVEEDPHYPDCRYGGMGYCGQPGWRAEEYWNCADIRILPKGSTIPGDTPTPTPAPGPGPGPTPGPEPGPISTPTPVPSPVPSPAPPGPTPGSEDCTTTVGRWVQCGGRSGAPPGVVRYDGVWAGWCCSGDTFCQKENEYYYQCKPAGAPNPHASPAPVPSPSSPEDPPATPQPSPSNPVQTPSPSTPVPGPISTPTPANGDCTNVVATWGQCGGKSNTPTGISSANTTWPSYCCASGNYCKYYSEWYWQCRLNLVPTPSPISTPTPAASPTPSTPTDSPTPSLLPPPPSPISVPDASPSPPPPLSTPTDGVCTTTVSEWGQCGGKSGMPAGISAVNAQWPGYCCAGTSRCTYGNDWYWQCLKSSSGSGGTSTPTPISNPTPRPSPIPDPPSAPVPQGSYNYAQLLALSYSFYEGQQTGVLPAWNRHLRSNDPVNGWRGDSYTEDGQSVGRDLSGGWFDAGDHVKFGLPFSWTVAVLAWSVLEYQEVYRGINQWTVAKNNIGHAVDWMVKAHVEASDNPGDNVYVCQVGDTDADHSKWCRPEDFKDPRCSAVRTVSYCDASTPGSNIVGNSVAAMAAYAIILRADDAADAKATLLMRHAKQLYAFAKAYPGGWRIRTGTNPYQGGANNGQDEMLMAAAMLCKAEGAASSYCTTEVPAAWTAALAMGDSTHPGADWDSAFNIAVNVLLATLPSSPLHSAWVDREVSNLKQWDTSMACPAGDGQVCYSAKGLAHIQMWGTLRHTANAAAVKLTFAKYVGDEVEARHQRCWARRQLNLMLGDWGRSFVVGYGNNPPVQPHHRAASCPKNPSEICDWNSFNSPSPNPSGPVGALVGGPTRADEYTDVRSDYILNEVAIDYNGGYTVAMAAMTEVTARLKQGDVTWDQYCGGAAMPAPAALAFDQFVVSPPPSHTIAMSPPPAGGAMTSSSTVDAAKDKNAGISVPMAAGVAVGGGIALVAGLMATVYVLKRGKRHVTVMPSTPVTRIDTAPLVVVPKRVYSPSVPMPV